MYTKIVPFPSRPFPPRKLRGKALAKELKKAKTSLAEYSAALVKMRVIPVRLMMQKEAAASLRSQRRYSKQDLATTHYLQTLKWAYQHAAKKPLSKKLLCTLHQKIQRGTLTRAELGDYRKKQNWIGPQGCLIDEAYFYPPSPRQVPVLMRELLSYAKKSTQEPLLQLALIFAQLLIIHPFMDGNGRLARVLISLFLYRKNCLPIPLFFMSHYFMRHRLRYFQTLYKTTEKNRWEEWIVFFLKGVNSEAKKLKKMLS